MVSKAILPTLLTGEKLYEAAAGLEFATVDRPKTLGKYMIVPVYDTLVARASYFNSGETTYDSIYEQVVEGMQKGNKDFLFDINSGGGEVTKCFATCRKLESLKKEHSLNFVAVVNEFACSAAYAVACVSDKIYAVRGSECGSIGVVMMRVDQTASDENRGVAYSIFRSKELKALGNPHETLTEVEIESINNSLTIIDNGFNMYVSEHRNITESEIANFKGQSFFAEEALRIKLVDEIIPYLNLEQITGEIMTEPTAMPTKEELAASASQAMLAERSRILAIQKLGAELSIPYSTVNRTINMGMDLEVVKDTFGMVREAVEANRSIETSQRPTATTKQSLAQQVNLME